MALAWFSLVMVLSIFLQEISLVINLENKRSFARTVIFNVWQSRDDRSKNPFLQTILKLDLGQFCRPFDKPFENRRDRSD